MTVQAAIDRLEAALDALDAALGPDGVIIDEELRELVVDTHDFLEEQGAMPAVRSAKSESLDELKLYFEDRFGRPLPIDLILLLRRRNGIVVTSAHDDAPDFDESCFLSAHQIQRQASEVEDWIPYEGDEPLPTLPVAATFPEGPVLALWIDESPGPYRVVAYDHETSSDRFIPVVAETLAEAIERFIECGLDVIETSFESVHSIDQGGGEETFETTMAVKAAERRNEKQRQTAVALEPPPRDHSPREIFLMCHDYVHGSVYQLNRWANALTYHLCQESEFRTGEREYLGQIAAAYVEALPECGEKLQRDFLDGWLRYPFDERERALASMDVPADGWPSLRDDLDGGILGHGEVRASYWLAFLSCLFMPGIGHFQAGQKAKGIVFGLSILVTCGLMWLLTPVSAYDLFCVRRAKLQRDVGPFEFFPS